MNIVNHRSFFFSLYLSGNPDLPEQFQKDIFYDHATAQNFIFDISIYYQHEIMRHAARRAALFVIARYGEGDMAVFNRDLIMLLAREVWKTRLDDMWMDAGEELNPSSSKRTKNV